MGVLPMSDSYPPLVIASLLFLLALLIFRCCFLWRNCFASNNDTEAVTAAVATVANADLVAKDDDADAKAMILLLQCQLSASNLIHSIELQQDKKTRGICE